MLTEPYSPKLLSSEIQFEAAMMSLVTLLPQKLSNLT